MCFLIQADQAGYFVSTVEGCSFISSARVAELACPPCFISVCASLRNASGSPSTSHLELDTLLNRATTNRVCLVGSSCPSSVRLHNPSASDFSIEVLANLRLPSKFAAAKTKRKIAVNSLIPTAPLLRRPQMVVKTVMATLGQFAASG